VATGANFSQFEARGALTAFVAMLPNAAERQLSSPCWNAL
jgi:hypothetical protein